jgi:hypothetical protein
MVNKEILFAFFKTYLVTLSTAKVGARRRYVDHQSNKHFMELKRQDLETLNAVAKKFNL